MLTTEPVLFGQAFIATPARFKLTDL